MARRRLVLILLAALLLAGHPATVMAQRPERITLATGSVSGVYYPYGTALAQVLRERGKPSVSLSVVATRGSSDNIRLLGRKEVGLAIVQSDTAGFAYSGTEGFSDKQVQLRAIAALYPELMQIVVRRDGPVKTVSDLKGLRVGAGETGGRISASFRQIMAAYGIREAEVNVSRHAFAVNALHFKDNSLDAFLVVAGTPSRIISDVAKAIDIRILPLDEDKVSRIVAGHPFLTPGTIPEGTYRGQTTPIPTLAVKALLVATTALSEEQAYILTRNLFANASAMAKAHPAGIHLTPQSAVKGVSIPFHPGALRYYQEAGIK